MPTLSIIFSENPKTSIMSHKINEGNKTIDVIDDTIRLSSPRIK